MFRKISCIFTLIIVILLLSISAFAADADKNENSSTAVKVRPPIITITKPNAGGEQVLNKEYAICGIAAPDMKNVRIELFRRNADGNYIEFKGTDGQSAWDVGQSGFFSIDVQLSYGIRNTGVNNFKIKAYDKTNPDINTTCFFTVKLLDPSKLKSDGIMDYSLNKYFKPLK